MLSFMHIYFTSCLVLMAYQDFRHHYINSIFLLPCLFLFIIPNLQRFYPNLLLYVGLLLLNQISHEKWIGNGDLDLLACGMCLITASHWLAWLNLACLYQLIWQGCYYRSHKPQPFVPSLLLAWCTSYFFCK